MDSLFALLMNWEATDLFFFHPLMLLLVNNERSFNIGIRKYKGDFFSPKGHKYIEDFETEIIPMRIYRVGSVILKEERLLVHYEEQFLVRYTILEANETMKLQIKPLLAFRNIHQLTHANMNAYTKVDFINNGIKARLYDGFPYLHLQLSDKADFIPVPDWYYGVEYPEEQKRGYDYTEDLFTPGFFEIKGKKRRQYCFFCFYKRGKTFRTKTKIHKDSCRKNSERQFCQLSQECSSAVY